METKSIIDVRDLQKDYSNGRERISIIQRLNLIIHEGDFVMIMGNSGSGKSTLLYLLGGIDKCTQGEIRLNNNLLQEKSEKDLTILRRKHVGFVFQEHHLVANLTLLENVLIAGYLEQMNRKLVRVRAQELMEELEIAGLGDRYPNQVSGGEAQRCAIVRALINNPEIVLADEPTGNLNSSATEKVLQILLKLNKKGQTIIMVTHNLNAACFGNLVYFMNDGQLRDSYRFIKEDDISVREALLFAWLRERGW